MKYKELEKIAKELCYSIRKDETCTVINKYNAVNDRTDVIFIGELQRNEIIIHMVATCPNDLEMLHAAMEYAKTPLDERNLFPRFYISSKLTPDDDSSFLFTLGGDIDHLAWGDKNGRGTKFTQKEIDYICDKFHTNLSDFNIEEVEE